MTDLASSVGRSWTLGVKLIPKNASSGLFTGPPLPAAGAGNGLGGFIIDEAARLGAVAGLVGNTPGFLNPGDLLKRT